MSKKVYENENVATQNAKESQNGNGSAIILLQEPQKKQNAIAVLKPISPARIEKQDGMDKWDQIINNDNFYQIATNIVIKNLRTCFSRGNGMTMEEYYKKVASGNVPSLTWGGGFILKEYTELVRFLNNDKATATFPFGMEVVNEVAIFLALNVGCKMNEKPKDTREAKDPKNNIARNAYAIANRMITRERRKMNKQTELADYLPSGDAIYYKVPNGMDIPDLETFYYTINACEKMGMSDRENQFLIYRYKGKSLDQICDLMNSKKGTINVYRKRVFVKACQVPNFKEYLAKKHLLKLDKEGNVIDWKIENYKE